MELLDVVDLGVLKVLERERIDVELHAQRLELLVQLGGSVLEIEVVREAGAAPADHTQPEPLALQVLCVCDFFHFGCGTFGDGDHR